MEEMVTEGIPSNIHTNTDRPLHMSNLQNEVVKEPSPDASRLLSQDGR